MSEEGKTQQDDSDANELISFGIIVAAGHARTLAFEALKAARKHDFEAAHRLLEESGKAALEAHRQQTALLSKEANGDHTPVDVMLVHAQDHLMTAMLAQELIEEILYLHETKRDR